MSSTPPGVTQDQMQRYARQFIAAGVPAELNGNLLIPKGYKGFKARTYRLRENEGTAYDEALVAVGAEQQVLEPTSTPEPEPEEQKIIEVDPAVFGRKAAANLPAWEPEEEIEIDLDLDEQAPKTLRFKNVRQPDGSKKDVTLSIPPIKVEYAMRAGRIQAQLAKTWQKMVDTSDEKIATNLDRQIKELNEKLVRLVVPDLPDGLLFSLGPRAWQKITETVNNTTQEAMGERTDVLAYVRDIYLRVGSPHGKTNVGLLMWLHEQFADLEDAYPNE